MRVTVQIQRPNGTWRRFIGGLRADMLSVREAGPGVRSLWFGSAMLLTMDEVGRWMIPDLPIVERYCSVRIVQEASR